MDAKIILYIGTSKEKQQIVVIYTNKKASPRRGRPFRENNFSVIRAPCLPR
jgi:hypothetical protein